MAEKYQVKSGDHFVLTKTNGGGVSPCTWLEEDRSLTAGTLQCPSTKLSIPSRSARSLGTIESFDNVAYHPLSLSERMALSLRPKSVSCSLATGSVHSPSKIHVENCAYSIHLQHTLAHCHSAISSGLASATLPQITADLRRATHIDITNHAL